MAMTEAVSTCTDKMLERASGTKREGKIREGRDKEVWSCEGNLKRC